MREAYVASPPPRGALVNLEIRARHRCGALIPTELTLSPVETAQRLLLIVILRDITERKCAEEQLRRQNQLLEEIARSERAAHQSRKRLESQLVQSEKLAALGQMVAGVAHEVNNPLAFVRNNMAIIQRDLGYLRTLIQLYQEADGSIEESRPELLARIKALAEQMDLGYTLSNVEGLAVRSNEGLGRIQQIVKNLRDFARLDEAELKEIDLTESIATTVAIARFSAHEKQVEITTELAALPRVLCYPAKFNQVILNLLSNAIDASPAGGEGHASHAGRRRRQRRGDRRDRLRRRHCPRDPRQDLRPVLHDQAGGQRTGPGPVDRLRHRATARGRHHVRERARPGYAVHGSPAPGALPGSDRIGVIIL